MSLIRLASRYSKSLLQLAKENKKLEEVYQDMTLLHQICTSNRDFVLMLKSPIIKPDVKQKILEKIFKGKITEITFGFFKIVLRKRREAYLDHVAKSFLEQYNTEKGISRVSLTTAVEIHENLKEKIKKLVQKATNSDSIDLKSEVDENILGGFVLKFQDKLYDASIARHLDTLSKEFSKSTYTKNY